MSLEFMHRFQLKIMQTLGSLIGEHVNQIHLSIVQDGNYPLILINFLKAQNNSSKKQCIYSLEFEICIFSSGKNKKRLMDISKLVEQLLLPDKLKISDYIIAGLKLNELFFNEAKDLIHNKLTMRYKTMIKKELA